MDGGKITVDFKLGHVKILVIRISSWESVMLSVTGTYKNKGRDAKHTHTHKF